MRATKVRKLLSPSPPHPLKQRTRSLLQVLSLPAPRFTMMTFLSNPTFS